MHTAFPITLLSMTLALVTPASFAARHPPTNFKGCQPDKTLFFSYTEGRHHAVEVCEVAGGYRYTYGRFTVQGERLVRSRHRSFQAILKPADIGTIHRDINPGFALKLNNTFIWLEAETDGKVNLVTAEGGWTGWGEPVGREAVALDTIGWGFINTLEHLTMHPFIYNNTKIINTD